MKICQFQGSSNRHETKSVNTHPQRRVRGRILGGVLLAACLGLMGTAGTLPSNAALPVGQPPSMPGAGKTLAGKWIVADTHHRPYQFGIFCQGLRSGADGLVAEYARDGTTTARRAQIRDELNTIGVNWRMTCQGMYGDILIFRRRQHSSPSTSAEGGASSRITDS